MNQGSSVQKGIEASREQGLVPVSCFSIVDYQMERAKKVFRENKIPFYSLTSFSELVETAKEVSYLTDQECLSLEKWHDSL